MFPSWAPPADGAAGIATRCDGLQGHPARRGHPKGVRRQPHRHVADTQQVLASVVRTARQRGLDLPPLIAEDAAVESLATDIVDLAKVRTDR